MKFKSFLKPALARVFFIMALCTGLLLLNTGCEKFDFFRTNTITAGSVDGNIAKGVIGRGYDISDRFAYSESIKSPVLDFSKLAGDKMILKDKNIAQTEVTTKEGETISEYQMSFDYTHTGSGGVDGLFSAEIGYSFGYDRAKSSGYSYATVSSYTSKYGIYIEDRKSPESLTDYVSDQFLNDIGSMDIKDLITKYGTHVIVGGIWGASLDFSMSAQRKSVSNSYSFGAFVSAEATIEGISMGGSSDISSEFSNYYESSSKKFTINAKGGNSEHALSIITAATPEGRDAAYAAWVQTIDDNPAFCDYYDGGLVPIYDFIQDEDIKAKLKKDIESYLKSKGIDAIELQKEVIKKDFDLKDFCMNTGQGDSNVDADGHGDISIEMNFALSIDMNNDVVLDVTLKVHELKGDYTKIEGSTQLRMYTNKNVNSINVKYMEYGFKIQGKYKPGNGIYLPISILPDFMPGGQFEHPKWLTSFAVCIDGKKNDDTHIIGVKGSVRIPVTILP